ncbi:hypothetical protein, partial [Rhizobium johnstonii]|uniref:hypothetical protein n=1 Tax=Rhizobium johnstonii TaxID=3019933 RepID=UPI003F98254D
KIFIRDCLKRIHDRRDGYRMGAEEREEIESIQEGVEKNRSDNNNREAAATIAADARENIIKSPFGAR